MSPLEIDILMHYLCFPEDHRDASNTGLKEVFKGFVDKGYLVDNLRPSDCQPIDMVRYKATDKLSAYCEALCKVPEPELKWIVG